MRGPKRASKMRKLFNLSKDDVHKYVNTYRTFTTKNGKKRKRARITDKKKKIAKESEAAEYQNLLARG
ncbi:40S ribosomal protein S6 [Zea mays]|uniref:40S ribosomal protein S6 n=2 Tax=Zea mays TaxID=4577 RepID=A0A8J8YCS4_MAIZE|nr:40S ribosomal protein S6-1 [Zea mays]PWZ26159.1 40S ribosomal protein S6 [Zea mays]